ncbi:hypothetical protein [Mycolicibacterium fortuitum]|uniref:hypothetical protein n=1 Tax=Mycolicibacterium fortuitum TaxID=1766 RepID=UPI003AAE0E21
MPINQIEPIPALAFTILGIAGAAALSAAVVAVAARRVIRHRNQRNIESLRGQHVPTRTWGDKTAPAVKWLAVTGLVLLMLWSLPLLDLDASDIGPIVPISSRLQ